MPGVFDEEDEDTFDIAMATEYSHEIFDYMRELEYRYLPDSDYMEHQPEINWEKRGRLVDCSPPSWTAAAAHYLSRRILDRGKWSSAHVYFSGYNEEQLKPAVQAMIESCASASSHHRAIYNKYADARFKKASVHVREWMSFMGYKN
ncbi:hypothetical protein D0Z03_000955 [Geotrichum reessii]|nr:hypothetical protein D0Z03_000955 [Galactomyces reessii]